MGRTRNQLVVSSIPIAMRNLLFFIAVLTEDGKSTKKRSHLEKYLFRRSVSCLKKIPFRNINVLVQFLAETLFHRDFILFVFLCEEKNKKNQRSTDNFFQILRKNQFFFYYLKNEINSHKF